MESKMIFNKDFDADSIYVMKIYDAEAATVWDYFTISELLDRWWAPGPWTCKTETQDFKEGGMWLYAMAGPEGERHYAKVKYGEITEHRSFDATNFFCDENGTINPDFPEVKWLFGFTGVEEGTKVTVNIHFPDEESLKKLLEMGFEGGFTMGLTQLEKIINQ